MSGGSGHGQSWCSPCTSTLLFISYETMAKLFNPCKAQFPHCKMEIMILLKGLNWMIPWDFLNGDPQTYLLSLNNFLKLHFLCKSFQLTSRLKILILTYSRSFSGWLPQKEVLLDDCSIRVFDAIQASVSSNDYYFNDVRLVKKERQREKERDWLTCKC